MTWNPISPDGSQSVKQNTIPMAQNTAYIDTTMKKDHFWDNASKEGHHTAVQMINYADTSVGAPTSPTLVDGMSLAMYAFTVGSQVLPYAKNSTSIMQLLGIRACAVFDGNGVLAYSHNMTSVTRTAIGQFTATYTSALPSADYLALGGGFPNAPTGGLAIWAVRGDPTNTNVKSTALLKFNYVTAAGAATDIQQGWIVVFGG